jgi:hypothetical protein
VSALAETADGYRDLEFFKKGVKSTRGAGFASVIGGAPLVVARWPNGGSSVGARFIAPHAVAPAARPLCVGASLEGARQPNGGDCISLRNNAQKNT